MNNNPVEDKKIIKYFGPATNSDPEMMHHMVGRRNIHGTPGRLHGYKLCIQKINNIRDIRPENSPSDGSPRQIIRRNFGDTFELYVLRPEADASIPGTIWDLTQEEIELVREWEMIDYGMQEEVNAKVIDDQGNTVDVEIQVLQNEPAEIDRVVDADNCDLYIAPKEKMWEMADWVRKMYLKDKKIIKYFGFGSNRDMDMMAHMVGNDHLKGEPGKLIGYELGIQKINQIRDIIPPESPLKRSPRTVIRGAFGDSFELYISRPKADSVIYGTIWDLTPAEFELVREWEMVDYGMQEDATAMAMDLKGKPVEVITQALMREPAEIDKIVTGEDYPAYIADRDKMLEIADSVRADYLKMKNSSNG